MNHALNIDEEFDHGGESLFAKIVSDIRLKGYSVNPAALPIGLGDSLKARVSQISAEEFARANVGRARTQMKNDFVRRDEICWISGASEAGKNWLYWMAEMQLYLNRNLFLGLFSFESHFSHYAEGDFYKRHLDAFKGEGNRVLWVVVYLNHDWEQGSGGELLLYANKQDQEGLMIRPEFGTMVVFLSEDFPHEVKKTFRDRFSIAGWFRMNSTTPDRVDPPQ